jgi:hypothetical protein
MGLVSYVDSGLDAVAFRDVPLLELGVAAACVAFSFWAIHQRARHDTGCPCLDCNPRLAMHPLIAMEPDEAARVIRDLGPSGPQRGTMGSYPYQVDFDPMLADRAQAALAHKGDHLKRMALVDRLYLDLFDANTELRAIPTLDPRARFWVVIGALSALSPQDIRFFVDTRGEP